MSRIVVDPITRIEGHLRIEAQVSGGKITDAWSSTTMWRGIETIINGRDPRDAWYFAQRICGVCTTVHALASVRAVEDALDIQIPQNAHLLRNLIAASQYVHDHTIHFYHLHALDWVDVVSALKADPAKAAKIAATMSDYPRNGVGQFRAVQTRLKAFVAGGRLGPFGNAYWGHPAYKLPAEVNLIAVSHYLDALDFQRDYAKVQALLGGKNPHPQTYVVGGMAIPISNTSQYAINDDVMAQLRTLLTRGKEFVTQAYVPDLLAIAGYYKDWAGIGAGLGNYMSAGDFERPAPKPGALQTDGVLPGGVIMGRNLAAVQPLHPNRFAEGIARSWYRYDKGDTAELHPYDGQTDPNFTGPQPPYEFLNVDGKYSWLKAPRYGGTPMEVGPLARMLVGYGRGNAKIKPLVVGALGKLSVPPAALFSTLGRTAARGLETALLADYSLDLLDQLQANIKGGDLRIQEGSRWQPDSWPAKSRGVGFEEAPRGTLSHWIVIEDKKVKNYQAVVPTTWNASPRDAKGQRGAYEAALIGTPIADPKKPLEILRTIHSFDPCMACAAHVLDADGNPVVEVKVQ